MAAPTERVARFSAMRPAAALVAALAAEGFLPPEE